LKPRRLYFPQKNWHPLNTRLGEAQSSSGRFGEEIYLLSLLSIESKFMDSQPLAWSQYRVKFPGLIQYGYKAWYQNYIFLCSNVYKVTYSRKCSLPAEGGYSPLTVVTTIGGKYIHPVKYMNFCHLGCRFFNTYSSSFVRCFFH